ncbi:MAG TPA: aminotransferase class V-fold PLP-dependent enzyme, partial [Arenibaculum sp.]|nr:aminotransferase class V-fold PLP-dependent enzyme [Arenibaculum sp.]
GTEANNHALAGTGRERLLVSAIEHDSVLEAARGAVRVPVTSAGAVDLDALDRLLAGGAAPALVSVMLVNNETGVVQPVAEAARIAHAHGALVHCDGVQAAGRLALDMSDLAVDLLSLSAHKIGGPKGVGALVVREGTAVEALLRGGGQERRRRAGTENVAGIAGVGAAARAALCGLGEAARLARLRDGLEAGIRAACADARFHGAEAVRVGNTSCIGMPGVPAETQLMAFDLAGLSVSTGAACSSGKVKASHVLVAMGVPANDAACAVRVSLGWSTGDADVARLIEAWTALHRRRAA